MPQSTPLGLVPGARLAFDVTGDHGPAVVQLHGLTSSRARDTILGLDLTRDLRGGARAGARSAPESWARVLRYDARGHGASTGGTDPASYAWPRLAEDLALVLDLVFPGERVHAVGPSMGAATQLHAAVRAPDRFASLTLVLPPTAWETRAARAGGYEAAAVLVETEGVGAFVAASLEPPPPAAPPAPPTRPDVGAELLPSVLRGAALSDLPPREAIRALSVPALVLAWTEDAGHPVSTAVALHELVPASLLDLARTPADVARWPRLLRDHVEAAEGDDAAQAV